MAACTHGFTCWLDTLARLLCVASPTPKPDFSRFSLPDLDIRIAEMDALRATHLDAAEHLQFSIEVLLEEKATRIVAISSILPRTRLHILAPPAAA